MSEAELNAMIDAMAAQVGHGLSPSSTISPASQFSPDSGSPTSALPTPTVGRTESVKNPNQTPASGSPTAGDPPLTLGGRISAAAFKRPASKMPGLPSNPRSGGGDSISRSNMAPSAHPRILPSPEPRGSTEEVGQASSQRAMTPPAQIIRGNQTPSPPPVTGPVQSAEHPPHEKSPTPAIPTLHEDKANNLESAPLPPAAMSSPPFPSPLPPASPTPDMDFDIIPTPEFEKDEIPLKPQLPSLGTSMMYPLASSQAVDWSRTYGPFVSPEGNKSVGMPLPPGAGPPRRPGDVVLPESLLPGGRRDSPVPPRSLERSNSPSSASPAQQNFTGVGSLAHTNKDGSRRLSNSPTRTAPPSLMPLDPYSPILDFGGFGTQKAPSNTGYGEGKFMTNLEDEYKQEKKADPKRGSESWR